MRRYRMTALGGVVILVLIGCGLDARAQGRLDPPPPVPGSPRPPISPSYFTAPPAPAPAANANPANQPTWGISPPAAVPLAPSAVPPTPATRGVVQAVYPPTNPAYPGYAPPGSNPITPVSGTVPAPQPLPNLLTPTPPPAARPVLPTSQSPSVVVEKRGPEMSVVGQPISYEIVVRNVGTCPVYQVRIDDELPAGTRCLGGDPLPELGTDRMTWNVGAMEPNAEKHLRVDVLPAGEGELRTTATVSFATAATLRTQVVRPRLNMSMTGPDQAMSGDSIPFQIVVSNPGSGPVTGLILRDRLPAGLQHPQGPIVEADLGTLNAGETRTVTLKATASGGGTQINEITASAEGGMEVTARAAVNVLEAGLRIKRSGPIKCHVRGELNCELELTNPGSAPAASVVVTNTLPAGIDFVSAESGGLYDAATRTIRWTVGAMSMNGKKALDYRVKAMAVGEQVEKAVAQAERNLEAKCETTVNVEGVAALMLEVVDVEGPSEVGAEMTYEIRVVNRGTTPCTNVTLSCTVPDGLQPRDGSGPALQRVSGQQVIFDPLPRLATKADAVFRVRVKAAQAGDYRFRAQVSCDQLRSAVYKEECSHVYKD